MNLFQVHAFRAALCTAVPRSETCPVRVCLTVLAPAHLLLAFGEAEDPIATLCPRLDTDECSLQLCLERSAEPVLS